MKSLIIILLTLFSFTTFAQKNFEGKAIYMSKRTVDMSRFGERFTEQQKKQWMARAKSFLEKTYTLSFNKTESSFKENVKLDAPGGSGRRGWGASNGQGSIYKNNTTRKLKEDIEMFGKRFLIVEDMEQPKWELGTESKKIGQYTCYKATLVKENNELDFAKIFSRRRNNKKKDSTKTETKKEIKKEIITAWYTPQLPVSTGPANYWGLPGLILEINAGRVTMLCTEVAINPENAVEIVEPTKGKEVSRDEYNKIMYKKGEELRERFQNTRRGGGRRF